MLINRKGQGIVEYILILVLLAIVAYTVIQTLGSNVKDNFNAAATKVKDSMPS